MKEFIKFKPVKITLIVFSYLIVLGLGGALATPAPRVETKTITKEVPVTKEVVVNKEVKVEKTPQACIDAIEIDNKIFTYIGENIASFNFDGIATYVEQQTSPRTAKILECYSKK